MIATIRTWAKQSMYVFRHVFRPVFRDERKRACMCLDMCIDLCLETNEAEHSFLYCNMYVVCVFEWMYMCVACMFKWIGMLHICCVYVACMSHVPSCLLRTDLCYMNAAHTYMSDVTCMV